MSFQGEWLRGRGELNESIVRDSCYIYLSHVIEDSNLNIDHGSHVCINNSSNAMRKYAKNKQRK